MSQSRTHPLYNRFLNSNLLNHKRRCGADADTCNNARDQKERKVVEHDVCLEKQKGYQYLTDIVGDTADNADGDLGEYAYLTMNDHK